MMCVISAPLWAQDNIDVAALTTKADGGDKSAMLDLVKYYYNKEDYTSTTKWADAALRQQYPDTTMAYLYEVRGDCDWNNKELQMRGELKCAYECYMYMGGEAGTIDYAKART